VRLHRIAALPPTIDVLIVTTRARELVLSCLDHLARQTVPHTIYLADNAGNEDGTTDAVRERFPEVRITTMSENRGFGKAMNELASQGSGEIVVLANDDMDVEPQFLERLVEPFEDERVGMVAGLTLQPGESELVDGYGIELDPGLMAYNRLRHKHPTDQPGRLLGPSGGAAAYRRAAWEAEQGFDPRFFVYGEDVDLALRLRLAGWEAAAAAGARGVHLGGATTGRDSPFQRQNGGFARGFLLRRYGVMRSRHAARTLLVELLTVLWGLVRFRTALPLTARIEGWRSAGQTPRLGIPPGAIDESISLRECIRRVRHER
jgi:N-acetylglucosaminyl-diphospho-decaprenol L-rhamnosyltransferase